MWKHEQGGVGKEGKLKEKEGSIEKLHCEIL